MIGFFEGAFDEAVFGIGDDGFGFIGHHTLNPHNLFPHHPLYGFEIDAAFNSVTLFFVGLYKLDSQIAWRNNIDDGLVAGLFQNFLNAFDAIFNLLPIIDVNMTGVGVAVFINADDAVEKGFDTFAFRPDGGYNGNSDELTQAVVVKLGSVVFQLIEHIEAITTLMSMSMSCVVR